VNRGPALRASGLALPLPRTTGLGALDLPLPNSRPQTRADVLSRLPAGQKDRYQSLLTGVDQKNQAQFRPAGVGPSAGGVALRTELDVEGRLTARDKAALSGLAKSYPAVRDLLFNTDRGRAGEVWGNAGRVMAGLGTPADKVALSAALRVPTSLGRREALYLATASATWSPRGEAVANKVLAGAALAPADFAYLRWRLNRLPATAENRLARRGLAAAIHEGRFVASRNRALRAFLPLYGGSYFPGGYYADLGILCPPFWAVPGGPPLDLSILPGAADPGAPPPVPGPWDDPGAPPPVPGYEDVPPPPADPAADSLLSRQTVRGLLLRNATSEKLAVFVQYRARSDKGEQGWFPSRELDGSAEHALRVEVAPGETVAVEDGGWRVYADRVRVWAQGGGREWNEFKGKDLLLVPETDGEGKHAYQAALPQALLLTMR
jgi:hypothetical protein